MLLLSESPMGLKQLVAAAIIIVLTEALCCNGCWEDERVGLLQIQASFNISWFPFDNKTANCCDWRGIECDEHTGRVTSLDVSDARELEYWSLRDWYLNASLFLPFKQLSFLDLSRNGITGCFQNEGFERLKILNNLEYLDLRYNNFGTDILSSLSGLLTLKSLKISHNKLKGSIYSEDFYNLKNLKELNMRDNKTDEVIFFKGLCNLNYLQTLDLSYNNLSGKLPLCLANLTSLQHLDLSRNNFDSTLPSSLSNLTSLQYLDLSVNSFVGNLFSSPLAVITSIQSLKLAHNNFQIPISLVPFYNCSSLSDLSIEGNDLYAEIERHNLIPKFQLENIYMRGDGCGGSFPKFLYSQHNLQSVDLRDIKMRGEFPHWLLENNTRLGWLYLSNNSLTGTIRLPSHSHVNLSTLDISTNCFTGQIPTQFGSHFPNLRYLDMSQNELHSTFPPSIGNMSSLSKLDLSINFLFGEITEFLNCSLLWFLDISDNDINGSLPMFSSCSNLRVVYLSNNNLHGSLTWAFINSSYLNTLALNNNSLNGTIPKRIGNFSVLKFLQLADNYLEGEIPIEVCMLNKLSYVDLSNNNISGQIPPCVKVSYNPSTYKYSPADSIEFKTKNTSQPYTGIPLELLCGIDLSCNKLTGQIPLELGNLTSIKVLNLSHNSLTGSIPSTFSNLEAIDTLDISHNDLEGKIPPQLIQLNSLSSFSVAYNNLSGRTPDMVKQVATFESTSYEGNPFLCGKPLSKSCEATLLSSPLPGRENDDGLMDMKVFCVSFGVSYVMMLLGIVTVLYINPYWRRVWFYFIERKMTDCYYFLVDLFRFWKIKK